MDCTGFSHSSRVQNKSTKMKILENLIDTVTQHALQTQVFGCFHQSMEQELKSNWK